MQRKPARGLTARWKQHLVTPSGDRSTFERSPLARLPDPVLRYGLTVASAGILVLIVYFFYSLASESSTAFSRFGVFGFTFTNNWDVSRNIYGALPLVVGTLITSGVALLIGVPVAVATALYITELCPRRLRSPLTILVELLAAVPSVVYGLWGFFVLIPKLKPAEQWVTDTFSFLPFVGGGTVAGPNYFIAGLILAIMIVPIVSAITREVMATVPPEHKEAALALGATRWEMIRIAVLPYSRAGITGAAMLGLGRAIGETIAVTIVIGNAPVIGNTIFSQGYSLAAVIANEFGEADALHRSALFAAGVLLFVLTLAVNALARMLVHRAERGRRTPGGAGGQAAVAGRGRRSMTSSALPTIAARRRRTDRVARGAVGGDRAGARSARADPLLPAQAGPRRVQLELLHHRSQRQLPRRPRRHQERDHRHGADGRTGHRGRCPGRHRRSRSTWSSTDAPACSPRWCATSST